MEWIDFAWVWFIAFVLSEGMGFVHAHEKRRLATRLHEEAAMVRHLNAIISVQRRDLSLLEQQIAAINHHNYQRHIED